MTNVAVFVPHRAQFGNITTQIPLLCAIRKEIGDANITIYTKAKSSQLLVCNGLADNVINYKGWNILKIVTSINSEQIFSFLIKQPLAFWRMGVSELGTIQMILREVLHVSRVTIQITFLISFRVAKAKTLG